MEIEPAIQFRQNHRLLFLIIISNNTVHAILKIISPILKIISSSGAVPLSQEHLIHGSRVV